MSRGFQRGIYIDNLPSCITREIIFNEFKKRKIDGALNFKVTRIDDKQSEKIKEGGQVLVKAFVGFSELDEAIKARNLLTHTSVFEKFSDGPCSSRVALITPRNKESVFKTCNYFITNLPRDITPREFDEAVQEFGTLISTNVIRGKGFIQFLDEKEAKQFELNCRNKNVKIRDSPIDAQVLKKREIKKEKTTLYFKEYNQKVEEGQEDQVKEQIKQHFDQVLDEVKDDITSILVSISKDHKKPYAFVNFKTEEATEKAKTIYQNAESENKFSYISLPDPDYKKNVSDHFVYIKPLSLDVTNEKLTSVLKQILGEDGVVQVRVKKTSHPRYQDSQFATILTKDANKADYIKRALNSQSPHFSKEFLELFTKDNKTRNTVCACFPFNRHQRWLQNRLNRGFNNSYHTYNQQIMPPQLFNYPVHPMFNPLHNFHNNPFIINQLQQQQQQLFFQQQQNQNQFQRRNYSLKNQNQQQNQQQQRNYSQGGNLRQGQNQNYTQQNRQNPNRNFQQQIRRPQQQQQQRQQQQQQGRSQQQQKPQQQQPSQPKQILQPKKIDPLQQVKANLENFKKTDKKSQIQFLGQLIYPKVMQMAKNKHLVGKIIQMLVDLETFDIEEVIEIIEDNNQLLERIKESEELLQQQQ